MPDTLLASTDVEDAVAQLYVRAVAAKAGYATSQPDFDRECIDLTIYAGGEMRPRLDLQLKATVNLTEIGAAKDTFSYQCDRRTYEHLRLKTQTPRILVVMRLPKDAARWLSFEPEELVVRHCAYWVSLSGLPELEKGKESKSVHLPKSNQLDMEGLKVLMQKARTGSIA